MVDFIDTHRSEFGVEPICALLPIASSSYYDAKSRPVSARARRHVAMTAVLVGLWEASYRVYGARKLWKAAQRAGYQIGRDQVAALMRAAGICGATRRRRVRTTRPDPCSVFLGGLGQGLGLGFLVGGLGFEHGEDDVAAASGDADHGGVVAFAL